MKAKTMMTVGMLALAGWLAAAVTLPSCARAADQTGYQVAQNDQHPMHQEHHGRAPKVLADQWYQGQRGHWYKEHDRWQWHGAQGDQWYQGQPGHWYQESNGWQFGSAGLVCNDQDFDCRVGGYLPPNGEGMVSRSNPSMFWQCDSHGHNCHWARRPRF